MRRKQEISEEESKTLLFRDKFPSESVSEELPEPSFEHCAKVEHLMESIPDTPRKRQVFHIGKICAVAAMILLFWSTYTFFDREHKTDALFVNSFRKMTTDVAGRERIYRIEQDKKRENPEPTELTLEYLPKNCQPYRETSDRNSVWKLFSVPNGEFLISKSYQGFYMSTENSSVFPRRIKRGGKWGWTFGEPNYGGYDFVWIDEEYVYYFWMSELSTKEAEKVIRGVR